MSSSLIGVLLMCVCLQLQLQLSFVHCAQPRLNGTEHDILNTLFDTTGGTAGRWNFVAIRSCLTAIGGPALIGRNWNFTKNAAGAYLDDPCQNDATSTKPFMGVYCSCNTVSCRVTNLYLPCGDLSGPIPSQLGGLETLQNLDLFSNSVTGQIPRELGNLKQLQGIMLKRNSLRGSIPDHLFTLSQLTFLDLTKNSLTGRIPKTLGNMAQMRFIQLSTNSFTGPIPEEVGNLAQLVELNLDTNLLTGPIPKELGKLKQLKALVLPENSLTGQIPKELGTLTQLLELDLGENSLVGPFPHEFFNLTNLQIIDLACNSLSGTMGSEFGQFSALRHLILANNTLTGTVPPELANLKSLSVLLLQNNSFVTSSVSNNAFSFISPQNFTKLSTLDVSNNEFTGTIPESIFELPALNVFAAGSNCFSGALPANICDAKELNTIAISGLSSAESCKRYYWKNTAFSGVFDGFGVNHFMEGSLPQCIYSMPKMVTLHAASNYFLGEAPFSGGDKSGLKISPLMRDVNVARNRFTGSISSELVTAATSFGKLRSLDLSYNRIGGNLSIFSNNAETFVDNTNPLSLTLEVNNLSGDIPAPLLHLKNINILAGNVFWCSFSRDDLPAHDYPNVESYQCDSSDLNNMLFALGIFVIAVFIVIQLTRHKQKIKYYVGVMKLWLEVAEGRRAINKEIQTTHMRRYFDYFRDLRYFVLVIGLALVVVFIVYLSLSGHKNRTITHTYAWVTTSAYLSGETSAILLMDVCICMAGLTWYLVTENKWGAKTADVSNGDDIFLERATKIHNKKEEETESRWIWLWIHLLPLLRVIILIVVIWGVLIGGNVLYLRILLTGTPYAQDTFKFAFAAFKLVWAIGVTNYLFSNEFLYFGVKEEHHEAFVNFWLGGHVKMQFVFNTISFFWIPLTTIMVVRPECFNNTFNAADPLLVKYDYEYCGLHDTATGACIPGSTAAASVYTSTSIPFVYNYTCSPAILKAYVPLYQQMFLLLMIRGALQLCYFCSDIDESESIIVEQKPEENNCLMSIINSCSDRLKGLVLAGTSKTIPTKHLMYNSSQRQALHKVGDERVFSMEQSIWITKAIPTHLSAIVILLTFAVLAPLLALSIIFFFLLESYISQMVLGRFLVTQLGVIMEYKRGNNLSEYYDSVALTPNEAIFVSPNKRARIRQDIEDATQPWGALAVLTEVEEQCKHMPASTLLIGRTSFVFALTLTMAFTVNDVLNNTRNDAKHWPSILLMCLTVALQVFTFAYDRFYAACSQNRNKHGAKDLRNGIEEGESEVGVELTESICTPNPLQVEEAQQWKDLRNGTEEVESKDGVEMTDSICTRNPLQVEEAQQWKPVHSMVRWADKPENVVKLKKLLLKDVDILKLQDPRSLNVPLHIAAQNGHEETTRMLLAAGADCNVKNCTGQTPLHMAMAYDYAEIAKMLLAAGAQGDQQNDKGFTAISGIDGDKEHTT